MKIKWFVLMFSILCISGMTGCAKKADTTKSIDQIKTEVQNMSVGDLQSYAQSYAKEISSKKDELSKVADQIKQLSPTEIFSEKAKSIKAQLGEIETQVSALSDRYQIYVEKFKEKGGDLSTVKIA